MNIDSIKNGIVIDHIQAGRGMELYRLLSLEELDCTVALIKNVGSRKMGKKDIIKIDAAIDLSMDILGYVDKDVTVNSAFSELVKYGYIVYLNEMRGDTIKALGFKAFAYAQA